MKHSIRVFLRTVVFALVGLPIFTTVSLGFAPTTITFSEFPLGTRISTQYASLGVLFSGNAGGPFISGDGANPTSPVLSGDPQFIGSITATFVTPSNMAQRAVARNVSLDAGFFDSIGSTSVTWFDVNSNELGSQLNTRTGIERFTIPGSIGGFTVAIVSKEAAGFAIDNLSFEIDPSDVSLSPSELTIATGGVAPDTNVVTVTGPPAAQVTFSHSKLSNDGGQSDADIKSMVTNDPQKVTVTAEPQDSSGIFALTAKPTAGGSESQPVTVTVPPQQFIQVLYGESVGQGQNAKQAIASVIGNRLHNSNFKPSEFYNGPNGLFTKKQFSSVGDANFNRARSRNTPGLSTGDYDKNVSIAASEFSHMLQDATGGCVFFVSPTATQYALVRKALDDKVKTLPPEIVNDKVLRALIGFGGASVWQIVILTNVENSTIPVNKNAPAFIFSRPKVPTAPAVVEM